MDFLGLRNLTVIDKAVKLIKENGADIDIEKLSLNLEPNSPIYFK